MRGPAVLSLLCVAASAGCGTTRLATARTVPDGRTRTTVAASLIYLGDRGFDGGPAPPVPVEIMVRHGVSDRVDIGARTFLALGALVDVKWGLLPADSPTSLAITAGAAGAWDTTKAKVLHVPLAVIASRPVRPWLTPYVAAGYSTYWIFEYANSYRSPDLPPRTGTGDGLLVLQVGVELASAAGRAMLVEYTYARPLVNDPGDRYGFAVNQFFSIGFRTGGGR